jgi:hypothetical protein
MGLWKPTISTDWYAQAREVPPDTKNDRAMVYGIQKGVTRVTPLWNRVGW